MTAGASILWAVILGMNVLLAPGFYYGTFEFWLWRLSLPLKLLIVIPLGILTAPGFHIFRALKCYLFSAQSVAAVVISDAIDRGFDRSYFWAALAFFVPGVLLVADIVWKGIHRVDVPSLSTPRFIRTIVIGYLLNLCVIIAMSVYILYLW
jgi:hypothetical protein